MLKGQGFIWIFLFLLALTSSELKAQDLHGFASVQQDISSFEQAGTELTLLAGPYLGLRYSYYPAISGGKGVTFPNDSSEVTEWKSEAEVTIPSLLWLLDYQKYSNKGRKPFDFLCAYLGLGFAKATFTESLTVNSYSMGAWTSAESTQESQANMGLLTFGFFGAESFVSVDARLEFLYSKFESLGGSQKIQQARLVFALGFGY
ncbi:MAG: hypothetical protein QNL04_02860 [SAR324 cluster bacterium]|nr:hypothetical protein [SAR324 cluster bacterium]